MRTIKILIAVIIAVLLGILVFLLVRNGREEPEKTGTQAVSETVTEEETEESEDQILVVTEAETTETATEPPETTPDPESLVTGVRYVKADSVNVRAAASSDAEKEGSLPDSAEVKIIEEGEEWTSVLFEGEICYVASRFLTEDKDWKQHIKTKNGYADGEAIALSDSWEYAGFSEIRSGNAVMYAAKTNRKDIVVGVNAGHGTKGGSDVKTWCHPDQTPKITGGTTAAGAVKAVAVSSGMTFRDGTPEARANLRVASFLREMLLAEGYDVLMIRDGDDVQLDNVARTVICNNVADCHIAIHFDSDGMDRDKGCFYMSVPNGLKYLPSVEKTWEKSERLGQSLINGLAGNGAVIMGSGDMDMDLTQTSYSTVPSVDIELGNQCSSTDDESFRKLARGLCDGVGIFFGQ